MCVSLKILVKNDVVVVGEYWQEDDNSEEFGWGDVRGGGGRDAGVADDQAHGGGRLCGQRDPAAEREGHHSLDGDKST